MDMIFSEIVVGNFSNAIADLDAFSTTLHVDCFVISVNWAIICEARTLETGIIKWLDVLLFSNSFRFASPLVIDHEFKPVWKR